MLSHLSSNKLLNLDLPFKYSLTVVVHFFPWEDLLGCIKMWQEYYQLQTHNGLEPYPQSDMEIYCCDLTLQTCYGMQCPELFFQEYTARNRGLQSEILFHKSQATTQYKSSDELCNTVMVLFTGFKKISAWKLWISCQLNYVWGRKGSQFH